MSFHLPRWTIPIRIGVLALALLLSVFLYINRDLVDEYRYNFKNGKGDVALDFRGLSEATTEKDLLTRYAYLDLYCVDDLSMSNLGPRICSSRIKSFHQHQALTVAFFLTDGHLTWAKIDVPWWSHTQVGKELIREYGKPAGIQNLSCASMRLVAWPLKSGSLFIEAEADFNPLQWSTISWVSPSKCKVVCLTLSQSNLPKWAL